MLRQTMSLLPLSHPLLAALGSSGLPKLLATCSNALHVRYQHSAVSDDDELPDPRDREHKDPRLQKIEAIRQKALLVGLRCCSRFGLGSLLLCTLPIVLVKHPAALQQLHAKSAQANLLSCDKLDSTISCIPRFISSNVCNVCSSSTSANACI
jgi:hypothetical protein